MANEIFLGINADGSMTVLQPNGGVPPPPPVAGSCIIYNGTNWTVAVPSGLTSAATAQWFQNLGANVGRVNDRLLIAGATVSDANFPNVVQDWLTAFQIAAGLSAGGTEFATIAALTGVNSQSDVGAVFGSQTLNFVAAGASCIGTESYAVNNNAALATSAWAYYGEAHKVNAAVASAYGMELDVRSLAATLSPTPYAQGDVAALQLAAGCGLAALGQFDPSSAIQIEGNPVKFKVGMVFGATSITGTDGVTGTGSAIAMAKGHVIRWQDNTSATVALVYAAPNVTAATGMGVAFTAAGLQILSAAGNGAVAYFAPPAALTVNQLTFSGSIAGAAPIISAGGTDANVNIFLNPKGATGAVMFGTFTAGVLATTGSIAIKDSGGVVRRLLVG